NATANSLDEARVGRHDGAAVGHAATAHRPLAENIVLHVRQDVAVMLVLVVVGVHVDDDKVVELALDRLLAGMGEKPGGVQLVDRYASAAVSEEVNGSSPDVSKIRLRIPCGRPRG